MRAGRYGFGFACWPTWLPLEPELAGGDDGGGGGADDEVVLPLE
jgi:hypothetical protein